MSNDINAQFTTPTGLYVSGGGITFDVNLTATNVVTGFNGLTGAVTGVTTSVANTFTPLQTFNAGISASGATFMGNINLQNAEFIRNTTNGRMDFMPAPSSATAYGVYTDFTTWTFGPTIGTIRSSDGSTNVAGIRWDTNLILGNDIDFAFGANQAYKLRTTVTNNSYKTLQLGLPAATSGYSSALALIDYAYQGSSLRQPNTVHSHPNLYIYSAGQASANDFVRFEHDRTNANIVTGQTSGILMQPGSGWLGVSGGISASNGVTLGSTLNVTGAVTLNSTSTHTGAATFNGGIVSSSTITISNNSPDIDSVLTSFDTSGTAKWNYPTTPIPTLGAANRYISPLVGTTNLTTASTFNGNNIYYFAFMINATCQVKAAVISAGTAPSGSNTVWAGVYAASRTTGKPTGARIGSFGSIATTTGTNTVFVSSSGVTLSPGMYWVGYWSATDAVTNFRRVTLDTTYAGPRINGAITPAGTSSYHLYYTEAGTTLPASVGTVSETTGTSITIPVPYLQIV
jgi:hypothetical protein